MRRTVAAWVGAGALTAAAVTGAVVLPALAGPDAAGEATRTAATAGPTGSEPDEARETGRGPRHPHADPDHTHGDGLGAGHGHGRAMGPGHSHGGPHQGPPGLGEEWDDGGPGGPPGPVLPPGHPVHEVVRPLWEAAADTLGLPPEELADRLGEGQTLGQIADERGVDREQLVAALLEVHEEQLTELLDHPLPGFTGPPAWMRDRAPEDER